MVPMKSNDNIRILLKKFNKEELLSIAENEKVNLRKLGLKITEEMNKNTIILILSELGLSLSSNNKEMFKEKGLFRDTINYRIRIVYMIIGSLVLAGIYFLAIASLFSLANPNNYTSTVIIVSWLSLIFFVIDFPRYITAKESERQGFNKAYYLPSSMLILAAIFSSIIAYFVSISNLLLIVFEGYLLNVIIITPISVFVNFWTVHTVTGYFPSQDAFKTTIYTISTNDVKKSHNEVYNFLIEEGYSTNGIDPRRYFSLTEKYHAPPIWFCISIEEINNRNLIMYVSCTGLNFWSQLEELYRGFGYAQDLMEQLYYTLRVQQKVNIEIEDVKRHKIDLLEEV